MGEAFTRDSIRELHRKNIQEILDQGKGAEAIVNYLMSRISTVISYERRKYERRLARQESDLRLASRGRHAPAIDDRQARGF